MPMVTPMRLLRVPEPFEYPDFVFEPKLDGFRTLVQRARAPVRDRVEERLPRSSSGRTSPSADAPDLVLD